MAPTGAVSLRNAAKPNGRGVRIASHSTPAGTDAPSGGIVGSALARRRTPSNGGVTKKVEVVSGETRITVRVD